MHTRITTAYALGAILLAALTALPMPSAAGESGGSARRVHPNPFTEGTTFQLKMPKDGPIRIVVYDMLGKQVRILRDGWHPKGDFDIDWDGKDEAGTPVIPGVYVCVLFSEGSAIARVKVVKLRA